MQLVASLPKPDGFFDPKAPAGDAHAAGTPEPRTAPRKRRRRQIAIAAGAERRGAGPGGNPPPPNQQIIFANSDLAFSGDLLFVGNFHGFIAYDIEDAAQPRLLASVVCPGGQGDVSVYGHL